MNRAQEAAMAGLQKQLEGIYPSALNQSESGAISLEHNDYTSTMNSPVNNEIGAMLVERANQNAAASTGSLSAEDELEMHLVTECHEAIFNYLMRMRNAGARSVTNLHEYAIMLTKSLLEQPTGGLATIKAAGAGLAKEPMR